MNAVFLAIAAVILMTIAVSQSITRQADQIYRQDVETIADNTSVYLSAAKSYVRSNTGYVGDVPDSVVGLPTWYVKLSGIRCYARSGQGFLYLTGVTERMGIEIADQMNVKHASGWNATGHVTSPSGETFQVPSQVPTGSYVIHF